MRTQRKQPQKLPSYQFSRVGYESMEHELIALKQKREPAVVALRTAREMGDLSENGAYKAARFELSGIDYRIRKLTFLLKFGNIVETENAGIVTFGRTVTIHNGNTSRRYTIVGGFESDPKKNQISLFSPLGKAMEGKRVHDTFTVHAPSGNKVYTITEIS